MKSLGFVMVFAKKYVKPLAIAATSMILLVCIQLLAPQVIRQLVAMVNNNAVGGRDLGRVTQLAVALLVVYAARAGLRFLNGYMAHVAGWHVVADARRAVYRHLQQLSLRFYEDQQTGDLMSRMVNDSDKFENLIAHAIPDTVVNLLMLVGVSAVMMTMSVQLTLLTMIPVPLIFLAMQGFSKYVRPAFRARQQELANLNARLNDNLSGIREIKAFTRESIEASRVGSTIDRYRDSMLRALRLMAIFGPSVEFSSSLGTIIVIFFGGRLAFQGLLPIEDLVAFFLYLDLFYQPVRGLSTVWENIQESLAGAERVAELLAQSPEIKDNKDAVALPPRVRGEIVFEGVGFEYIADSSVLDDINLRIPANSVAALVGPTGVGKTTLASLIPRFYDVREGRLLIDGHDVRDVQIESLRRQVSMVLQDVFLFHGTVRENIVFGRADATEEEVIQAARVANAHDFITKLSEGYDTMIGERGIKLSGGQKQRISIARAVLKDAPILILDEATSSVDTETEMLIQEALERLMKGRTTLIIAHRLSTVRKADKIVVLEGKRISEQGTHEQLMSRDGLYQHLWDIQGQIMPEALTLEDRQRLLNAFSRN